MVAVCCAVDAYLLLVAWCLMFIVWRGVLVGCWFWSRFGVWRSMCGACWLLSDAVGVCVLLCLFVFAGCCSLFVVVVAVACCLLLFAV